MARTQKGIWNLRRTYVSVFNLKIVRRSSLFTIYDIGYAAVVCLTISIYKRDITAQTEILKPQPSLGPFYKRSPAFNSVFFHPSTFLYITLTRLTVMSSTVRDRKEGSYCVTKCPPGNTVELTSFGTEGLLLLPGNTFSIIEFPAKDDNIANEEDYDNDESLPFLGGSADDADDEVRANKIHPDSVYARLPRPSKFPGPSSSKSDAAVKPPVAPDDARIAYKSLFDGACYCTVHEQRDRTVVNAVVGHEGFKEPRISPEIQTEDYRGAVMFYAAPRGLAAANNTRNSDSGGHEGSPFWCVLNEPQRDALLRRVLHRLIRSYGFCLPSDFIQNVSDFLVEEYISARQYKEALDIATVSSDIAIGKIDDMSSGKVFALSSACKALGRVAEVLEACGRFEDAGNLWLEIAKDWTPEYHSDDLFSCYLNGGLAFKRNEDYSHAEDCYVKALFHSHGSSIHCSSIWSVNSLGVHTTFNNLLKLYWLGPRWDVAFGPGASVMRPDHAEQCILGLLHSAGYDFHQESSLATVAKQYSRCLSSKFKSAARAKKAIADATTKTDVQVFRSRLSSCWDPKVSVASREPVAIGKTGRENRKDARDDYVQGSSTRRVRVCFALGCGATLEAAGAQLMYCPCKVCCQAETLPKHYYPVLVGQ